MNYLKTLNTAFTFLAWVILLQLWALGRASVGQNIYLVCPILNWKPISPKCLLDNSTEGQTQIVSFKMIVYLYKYEFNNYKID